LLLCAACIAGRPSAVFAQSTINPYASVQIEHDSNVFRVENEAVALSLHNDPTIADTDFRYIAGLDGTYLWSLQKLSVNLEGREIEYDHFKFLNHSEYLGNLQWDWKVSDILDGLFQARQEHLAAYFADSNSPYLEVDTDRNIVGKLNFIFRTDWRLETGANFRTYEAPLQQYPDFVDKEDGTHLGVSYLGVANLTYGVGVDHINGTYEHAIGVGPYTQTTESLRMNYVINGLQTVTGALGYTKRNQTDEQNLSAVTGQLKYVRQLTGKTSVSVSFVRAVNSYLASAGSEIDTSGTASVQWQATYKLAVNVAYSYQTSEYIGQVINSVVNPTLTDIGRTDHLPSESLNVVYQPLKRIQIKAYVNAQQRHSNVAFDRFNDTTFGVQAIGHWR
jgi:hypothetical protein